MTSKKAALVGALALSILGATSAASAVAAETTHTLPEWGRCVAAVVHTATYKGANCVEVSPTKTGNYEWTPASTTEDITLSGVGSEAKFTTPGHGALLCTASAFSGTLTGPKTALVTIELQGCANSAGEQCQNLTTQNKSQIETVPLEAELGYIKREEVAGKVRVAVGLDLKPQPPLTSIAVYDCGSVTETAKLEGSVIGKFRRVNAMLSSYTLLFKTTKAGQQVPEAFQGSAPDTLSTTFMNGLESTTAPTTLSLDETGLNASTPFEIKALER